MYQFVKYLELSQNDHSWPVAARQIACAHEFRVAALSDWCTSVSKEPRAVEYARDCIIQIDATQAGNADNDRVLVVAPAPCESMDPALLAEVVIREVPGAVPRETVFTAEHAELIGWHLLQYCASTDAK